MTQDIRSRADEIELELIYLNLILRENPLNESAKHRRTYLRTILAELTKYVVNKGRDE